MKRFYVANKVIRELQLSSKAINVYDYLCMCVNKNNECFPSKRTIAANCSISVASVTRALRELENAKMISTVARFEYVQHEKSYVRQTSNIYHIYETPQIENDKTPSVKPSEESKMKSEKKY
jgi:DNA-binding transcriptional regulator YhcF (GntR family)